jgi:hemolysin III
MTFPAMAVSSRRPAERWADLCVLVSGLLLGASGAIALLAMTLARCDARVVLGIAIYVAALLAMLGSSLTYHAATGPTVRRLLRRLDHAAIFAMIAGTVTPFALGRSDSAWGSTTTAAIWVTATIGIVVKLRSPIGSARRSAIPYLLLGWVSAAVLVPSISPATGLRIAAGGALYTIGVAFYLWRRLPFHGAIWHAFVLAGAACHYLAIVDGVVLGRDNLI